MEGQDSCGHTTEGIDTSGRMYMSCCCGSSRRVNRDVDGGRDQWFGSGGRRVHWKNQQWRE